jgi:recombination associated protein RdgC
MWFKNLTLFRLVEPFTLSAEALAGKLAQAVFYPCTPQAPSSHGWVPPLGRKATDLVQAVGGCLLVCLKTEEKLLPAAVVREIVADQVAEIEAREQRPVRRPEQQRLREDVLQALLPRALTRSQRHYAYIDTRGGWLVVDSVNRTVVERLTRALRGTLSNLPITPLRVASAPAVVMTAWLADNTLADDFALADECELQDREADGGVVRCKGQDLGGAEILTHLQAGKQVTRLGLTWNRRIALVLTEELSIRRLRFLDVIKEQLEGVDTAAQLFDAQFALMSAELAVFLPRLLAVFE